MSTIAASPLYSKLTPPQQQFCLSLANGATAPEAAEAAFQTTSKASARAIASKLLKNSVIRAVCGLGRLKPQTRARASANDLAELNMVQAEQDECVLMNGVKFTDPQRRVLLEMRGEERESWRRTYYIENRGTDACLQCKKPMEPKAHGSLYCGDECKQAAWRQLGAEIAANGGQLPSFSVHS
jgi:hypothetical protein